MTREEFLAATEFAEGRPIPIGCGPGEWRWHPAHGMVHFGDGHTPRNRFGTAIRVDANSHLMVLGAKYRVQTPSDGERVLEFVGPGPFGSANGEGFRDPETKERVVDYGPGGRLPAVPA